MRLHRENLCIIETRASHVLLKEVSKSFGDVLAIKDLTLEIKKGEFFSLLGPSGCGKTTLLRLIAGLERPDRGTIEIGNKVVAGNDWIPPEKRRVGLVFQDYALFPHMTVFENIAFGLKGCSKSEIKKKVTEMLELTGLLDLSDRYPYELSGGQQQRVALARSLATSPEVMLLDEPFSNLDADLRAELRRETKRILKEKGTTTILVTHDQEEAFCLSDRIGVLNHGMLEQVGTPEEIYHRPRTRFVANFVGRADFIKGRIEEGYVISDIGIFSCGDTLPCDGGDIEIMIRPDDVDFILDKEGESSIIEAEFLGPEVIYKILLPQGKIIHSIKPSTKTFPVGSRVSIKVDPSHIVVFPVGGN
ncbi:MAG: ABC transporter ATP-binding protein [Thermodesulfovibrionales bacterium]|nr:ABC transporter ATP-binding protein [Thermodesulfovibrionales bacterium]